MAKQRRRSCVTEWRSNSEAMETVETVALRCVLLQMEFNVSCLYERHRRKDDVWQDTVEALTSYAKCLWDQREKVHAVPETATEPRDLGTWRSQLTWRGKRDREVPTCCGHHAPQRDGKTDILSMLPQERVKIVGCIFYQRGIQKNLKKVVSKWNKILAKLNYCREFWSVSCRFLRCGEATRDENQKHVVITVMSLPCALQVSSQTSDIWGRNICLRRWAYIKTCLLLQYELTWHFSS